MTYEHDEAGNQVSPTTTYPLFEVVSIRRAKVQTAAYPPLKSNPGVGAWRRIPRINLRGFWLEQAGFGIDTRYMIEVYENKLVFTVI